MSPCPIDYEAPLSTTLNAHLLQHPPLSSCSDRWFLGVWVNKSQQLHKRAPLGSFSLGVASQACRSAHVPAPDLLRDPQVVQLQSFNCYVMHFCSLQADCLHCHGWSGLSNKLDTFLTKTKTRVTGNSCWPNSNFYANLTKAGRHTSLNANIIFKKNGNKSLFYPKNVPSVS